MTWWPPIYYRDEAPEYLYKYCTRNVYDKHIKAGEFRMGTLADYRTAFEEKGAEYGDYYEGNEAVFKRGPVEISGRSVGKQGGVIIDRNVNAYVFSASSHYSKNDHKKWFARKGCNYDLCIKLRSSPFLNLLAHKIDIQHRNGKVMCGKPLYDGRGVIYLENETPKTGDIYLYKNPNLAWEKEYRLVYLNANIHVQEIVPFIASSSKFIECIEEVIPLNGK